MNFKHMNKTVIPRQDIHSGYFYSASSSAILLLRGAPDCHIDTVSELTCRSTTGN